VSEILETRLSKDNFLCSLGNCKTTKVILFIFLFFLRKCVSASDLKRTAKGRWMVEIGISLQSMEKSILRQLGQTLVPKLM